MSRVFWQAARLVLHITISFGLVYLGLYLVVWTQVAQMLLITVVFFALPVLALGGLELIFEGYRKIPFLGWFLCVCTFSIGVVLSLVIAIYS